jgi:RimJ/RimL family protein N-acetyltransferase
VAGLTFRPMTRADLPLLHGWLQRPHVKRWWDPRETLAEVEAHYLPRIAGDEQVDLYLAVEDGIPIAFVQTYLQDESTTGIDLFVADEERTGKGFGSGLIRRFVDEIVFARPETTACIADPEPANAASIRAFEKAGFVRAGMADERHVLVRKERSRPEAAS